MTRLTVTLCGSLSRAPDDLARVAWHLAAAGHDVRAPKPAPADVTPTAEQVRNLVAGHLDDITRSVIVLGIVPDGLVGDHTGDQMAYAARAAVYTRWALSPVEVDELLADIAAGRLLPAEPDNDIGATGRCCCAGCLGVCQGSARPR